MERLISAATQVNYFLVMGGLLSLTAILAKFFIRNEEGTVEIAGVKLPLNHTWIAMSLLTLAHAYYSWAMLVGVARVLDCHDAALSQKAWAKLTGDADHLRVLFDMSKRSPARWSFIPVSDFSSVSHGDLLLLMHVLLVVAVFAATVRWFRKASRRLQILTTLAAILLVAANWVLGSQWALLASDLARSAQWEPRHAPAALYRFVARYGDTKCRPVEEVDQ